MPDVITIVRAVYSGMSQRKVAQDVPGGVVPGETRPWRCGNGPGACGYERVDRGEPTGKVFGRYRKGRICRGARPHDPFRMFSPSDHHNETGALGEPSPLDLLRFE